MSKADSSNRVYPSAPLEEVIVVNNEQQQKLLLPPKGAPTVRLSPPSYDQATTGGVPVQPTDTGGQHVVLIAHPPAVVYGPHPVDVQCPYCHNYTRTQVRHGPNTKTHLFALLLCLLQLYCCFWMPYCIKSCQSANHYCGMCNQYLGTYNRG